MALAFALGIALFGCAGRRASVSVFRAVEVDERTAWVDAGRFPQSVRLFFCADDFDPQKASLTEVVGDRVDEIPFSAWRSAHESTKVVVFVEDCSGSVKELVPHVDSYMLHVASGLCEGVRVGLVRFGKRALWAQEPVDAERFAALDLSALPYPPPNGTFLHEGILLALDACPDGGGVVVVISDGGFSSSRSLDEAISEAAARKTKIIAVQVGGLGSRKMTEMAEKTQGFYLKGLRFLPQALSTGWCVEYTPAVSDTDGAEHRVIVRWGTKKRTASYFAPGSPREKERALPPELVEGVRIPFVLPDNARIISQTRAALDSLLALLGSCELPEGAVLIVDGYTCDLGDRKHNYDLSLRRAKVVANYIRTRLQQPVRFDIVPHGEDDPLVPNTCEANRRVNRRVEVRLAVGVGGKELSRSQR